MLVVLYILAAFLGLLLAVLSMFLLFPIFIEARVQKYDRWQLDVTLRPLGGYGPRIRIPALKDTKPRDTKLSKDAIQSNKALAQSMKQPKRFLTPVRRLIARILRSIRFIRLQIDARIGLSDPAETGQIFGLYTSLRPFLPRETFDIWVHPVFGEDLIEGDMLCVAELRAGCMAYAAAVFLWDIRVRQS